MNAQEMLRVVDSIARDRNVDKEALYRDIEQAMISAARKYFDAPDTDEFTCEVDQLAGDIRLYRGQEEIPFDKLGRIPAQTAKQVMIQKFREDERTSIYEEFASRVGELVTGTAQRYEGGALVVTLGRAEGFMPKSEQIPGEQHHAGERVRCLILDVRQTSNQVKIVLSRAHPDFIRRLFEVEVPEVQERIIEVKSLSREPGHRTKVAVASIDSKVDAVGACVGVRGSRIKNIVDELGGEKIDAVRWNESSQVLIANALRPAEIVEISLCFELDRATVVVNESQLSLAIGKRGQNVRLAARLTGWDVDILTPAEYEKGLETMEQTLKQVEGVTEQMIDRMAALGLINVFDVEEVGPQVLLEHLADVGTTEELAQRLVERAGEVAREVSEQQRREREEGEHPRSASAQEPASAVDERAAAILGGEEQPAETGEQTGEQSSAGTEQGEAAGGESGDILDMLEQARASSAAEPTGESDAGTAEDSTEQATEATSSDDAATPSPTDENANDATGAPSERTDEEQ